MGLFARTLAAAGAAVLLFPASGLAQTWSEQNSLGPTDPPGLAQSAALGSGQVVTVFRMDGFGVISRTGPASGIRSAIQLLGDSAGSFPTVAADAEGRAIAAWYDDTDRSIRVSMGGTATQPFAAPAILAAGSASGNQFSPDLAVSPDGSAAVLFAADGLDGRRVYVSVRSPGGGFGPAAEVAPTVGDFDPQLPTSVAINDRGETVIGYQQSAVAHVAVRTPGPAGTWLPAEAVGAPKIGYSWGLPEVGIDWSGGVVAVWEEGGVNIWGGGDALTAIARIKAAFRPPGGTFGATQDLGIYTSDRENPTLGVSAAGEAIVVARQVTPVAGDGIVGQPLVVLSGSTVLGRFDAPRPLSAGAEESDPQLAMNARGDAVVTTLEECCPTRLLVRRRGPFAGFYRPQDLHANPPSVFTAGHVTDVDVDQLGNAAVTWTDSAQHPDAYVSSDGPPLTSAPYVTTPDPLGLAELVPLDLATQAFEPGAPWPIGQTAGPPAAAPTIAPPATPGPAPTRTPAAVGRFMVSISRAPSPTGVPRIVVAVRCPAACRAGLQAVLSTPANHRLALPRAALTLDAPGVVSGSLRLSPAALDALRTKRVSGAGRRPGRHFSVTVTATTGDARGAPQTAVVRLSFVRR
jgi:hypothetical protein